MQQSSVCVLSKDDKWTHKLDLLCATVTTEVKKNNKGWTQSFQCEFLHLLERILGVDFYKCADVLFFDVKQSETEAMM